MRPAAWDETGEVIGWDDAEGAESLEWWMGAFDLTPSDLMCMAERGLSIQEAIKQALDLWRPERVKDREEESPWKAIADESRRRALESVESNNNEEKDR